VSGKRWGTLIAVFSMEREEQRIASSRWQIMMNTLIFSALAAVGIFLILSRLVVKPILELAEASKKIQDGTLEARVKHRPRGRDEVEHLKQRFNRMADKLEEHTRGLEKKVEERTQELKETNQQLLRAKEQLEELAITDGLTGAFNYRHLKNTLGFEMERQKLRTHPLCYLMIDVDNFKHYNDTNGHPAGDEVLRIITKLLKESVRDVDFIARYGGEEFAVLLLDTPKAEGYPIARHICQVIEQYPFAFRESQPEGKITISVGLAAFPEDAADLEALIQGADSALYVAKQKGKNRVEIFQAD